MSFHVGQQVICVDGFLDGIVRIPGQGYGDELGPVPKQVYTIRGFQEHLDTGEVGLLLEEIINLARPYYFSLGVRMWEPAFKPKRFLPLKTTDISIFTAMLVNAPQREPVA